MGMGDAASEILMKLVLKGIEPTEAQRLANQPLKALEAELNASLGRQVEAHRQAAQAQTAESQKAARAEVRDALGKTKEISAALQMMEREAARAAKGMSSNWRRAAEDMENITIVARGAWDAISGGAQRLKALGDSIAQTTNIYGSLKGSIDTMREASKGQIADIDLITTKNRAAQKELNLTDEQFGLVAASADIFADALGTNTKDALDGLIDGLATGRLRSLAMAGVIVNETQAYIEYAKKIDVAVDKLSDHDKAVAKLEASLRGMNNKIIEAGGNIENFGDKWDKANAKISNISNELKLELGGALSAVADMLKTDIPQAVDRMLIHAESGFAKFKIAILTVLDPFNQYTKGAKDEARQEIASAANVLKVYENMIAEQKKSAQGKVDAQLAAALEKKRRDTNPTLADRAIFGGLGDPFDAGNAVGGDRTPGRGRADKEIKLTGLEHLFLNAAKSQGADRDAEEAATFIHELWQKKLKAAFGEDSKLSPEDQAAMIANPSARVFDPNLDIFPVAGEAQPIGMKTALEKRAKEQAPLDFLASMGIVSSDKYESGNDVDFEAEADRIIAAADRAREKLLKTGKERLGFLSVMFGDDFIAKTREEMTELENAMADQIGSMSAMIKGAGQDMAGALGASIAASIGENKNFLSMLKQQTHAVMMALSARAFGEAAWESAMALKDLAIGNFPGAALHGSAAAAFAGVGALAGLGARATNSSPGASAPVPAGSGPTIARSSSGGGNASTGEKQGDSDKGVTLIVNSMFGDPVSIGRSIDEAFQKYRQQTGREIGARP